VTFNGRRLPLLYVSSTQINAQVRYDMEGSGALRVTTPSGGGEIALTLQETAPAIFLVGRFPAVTRLSGGLISPTSPAAPGEAVCAYVTGLGRPDVDVQPGQAAPISPLALALAPVQVLMGDQAISPLFAGLTPGFAGLYQVNFILPERVGTHQFRIVARGVSSNTVGLVIGP